MSNSKFCFQGVIVGWHLIARRSFQDVTQRENGFDINSSDVTMKQYAGLSDELSKRDAALDMTYEDSSETSHPWRLIDDKMRDVASRVPASLPSAGSNYNADKIKNCGDSGILSKDLALSEMDESSSTASKRDHSVAQQICTDRRLSVGDLEVGRCSEVTQTIVPSRCRDRHANLRQILPQSNLHSAAVPNRDIKEPMSPESTEFECENLDEDLFVATSRGFDPACKLRGEVVCTRFEKNPVRLYYRYSDLVIKDFSQIKIF